MFSQRRSFIMLLSIFFLTLPDTNAKQIGLYTGIGTLASFFIEIPSGYFADSFGHKKTLILSKILMVISTFLIIIADNFYYFIFVSTILSISFAFGSGTTQAFYHDTLEKLGKEKEFSKRFGRVAGTVSLASFFLSSFLPFLVTIDILLPFKIGLGVDIIGLIFTISLFDPGNHHKITKKNKKSIWSLIKEHRGNGFLPLSIFSGAIIGYSTAESSFRFIYLEYIGLPVVLVGLVFGLSRLVWFGVGHYSYLIPKKFSKKKFLLFEVFIFSIFFFIIGFISNPYFVAFLMILIIGYMWGRSQILTDYIIKDHIKDSRYKATMLSVKGQISFLVSAVMVFILGFLMNYSYELGYYFLGFVTFITLAVCYGLIKE